MSPSDYCRNALKNTTIIDSPGRPWTYQYCSEFGFYQTPSHVHAMRPALLLNETYWVDYCQDIFQMDLKINRTITQFSWTHTAGTNTIFTNGIDDPWQWATELNPEAKLNQVGLMANCTDCGHCADLGTPKDSDPSQLKEVRENIMSYLNQFFKPAEPLFLQA